MLRPIRAPLPHRRRFRLRTATATAAGVAGLLLTGLAAAPALSAAAAATTPDPATRVVVRFKHGTTPAARTAALAAAGVRSTFPGAGGALVGRLRPDTDATTAAAALARRRAVAWATPAFGARVAQADQAPLVFDDPGTTGPDGTTGGWLRRQWDLTGAYGIRTPEAWELARKAGGEGGRGVTVAVLDTGVAYADRGPYRRSPDLPAVRMVRGRDFVDGDDFSNDEDGHGTFIAGEIAAAANNGYGMVGVAYAAKILAVRVLDQFGQGSSFRVAQGIRYAVDRGAKVINVSIQLTDQNHRPATLTAAPDIRGALRYARQRGVSVVAAAGNDGVDTVPGRSYAWLSIQVGGTTERGCVADYSNTGPGLDLVAPGGGSDSRVQPDDPRCRPNALPGRAIRQVTFRAADPTRFLVPDGYAGTSMAAPHVTGTIALMLAARTLGENPTPEAIAGRLKATARDLGYRGPDRSYGAGLLDAAAALGAAPLPAG
ncbi:protease [Paraconexibacter sp. AEG42_29]|uniref:Protease n=1 Tax=Paraconexibacter sp. AEG42_29 TaxID=2997339 RepID=A0AAU7ARD5_9ACTN